MNGHLEQDEFQRVGDIVGTVIVNGGGEALLIPEDELQRVEGMSDAACEHCGAGFQPRKGSGGRPQRFCSSKCRLAWHAVAQRDQRSPTCATQPALAAVVAPEPQEQSSTNQFDWRLDKEDVLLHEQRETAVYINPVGAVVIRQRADWDEEDDPLVIIQPEHLVSLIDKLCDIAGIPSAGGGNG